MDNIQVTNIEKGVIVNPSKKIKISQFTTLVDQWNAIVESAKENDAKVDLKSIDAQPDWNAKPEWEIVTNSFENVDVEKHARPIRVAEESYKNIEIRGFDANKYDFVQLTENDDTIPTFNYEENKTLEDYGYTEDFSKTVEDVINNTNFEEPKFEVPEFDEYGKEDNEQIEINDKSLEDSYVETSEDEEKATNVEKTEFYQYEKEDNNQVEEEINISDIERMVEEELNKKENTSTLGISDVMKEFTQISEANDQRKGNIASLKDRNIKMEKSIVGIENETKEYDKISLETAKKLLLKAKEEDKILRTQEEDVINEGKNLKDRLISADEANLSAKGRKDSLSEMLDGYDYQPKEDNYVKTFAA